MSRPIKLSEDIQDKICNAIRAGNYIETAAAYAGIAKSTLYDWMRRGEREKQRLAESPKARVKKSERPFVEFSDAIEKALADSEVRDVSIIGKAAEDYWQAAAWRLERKFPDRWGRKDKVTADMNHTGSMEINNPFEDLTTEELRAIARQAHR